MLSESFIGIDESRKLRWDHWLRIQTLRLDYLLESRLSVVISEAHILTMDNEPINNAETDSL